MEMKINPFTQGPTLDLDFRMSPVALTKFNDFSRAHANFDFELGTLAVTSELAASNGRLKGYMKPLFDKVDIVDVKDNIKNPEQLAWEGIVGTVTKLFRNQPKSRFATKIPLEGRVDQPKALLLPTTGNIFHNAFVQAYGSDIENAIELEGGSNDDK